MKVYIVGDHGPEHNSIKSVHRTYEEALRAWNELRIELLDDVRLFLKDDSCKEMYEEIIKNLSCEDPDKIDNFPQETPYVEEIEVKD